MLKPYREIYNALLDKYDLKAEEYIFIDDSEVNIEGSKTVDIDGVILKTVNRLMRSFKGD